MHIGSFYRVLWVSHSTRSGENAESTFRGHRRPEVTLLLRPWFATNAKILAAVNLR
jgi:hypothetical protein